MWPWNQKHLYCCGAFQYLELFRRSSRVWQTDRRTDGRTDKAAVNNNNVYCFVSTLIQLQFQLIKIALLYCRFPSRRVSERDSSRCRQRLAPSGESTANLRVRGETSPSRQHGRTGRVTSLARPTFRTTVRGAGSTTRGAFDTWTDRSAEDPWVLCARCAAYPFGLRRTEIGQHCIEAGRGRGYCGHVTTNFVYLVTPICK